MVSLIALSFDRILRNPELYKDFEVNVGELELERIIENYVLYLKQKSYKSSDVLMKDILLLEKYAHYKDIYWALQQKILNNEEIIEFIWQKRLFNWAKFIKNNNLIKLNDICFIPLKYQQIYIMLCEDRIENLKPTLDIGSIENFKVSCFYGMKRVSKFLYQRIINPVISQKTINIGDILTEGSEYYLKGNNKKDVKDFWDFLTK